MSRVDDRIRRELARSEPRVDADALLALVARRRRRVRAIRRARIGVAVVAVVASTAGGLYGFSRLIGAAEDVRFGGGGATAPTATISRAAEPGCDLTRLEADADGDGALDLVEVHRTAICEVGAADPGSFELRVTLAPGDGGSPTVFIRPLSECTQRALCRLFATPDLDGDGASEVAVQTSAGVSTVVFSLYRLDETNGLERIAVAEPGDPWDEQFGLPAGSEDFLWYGSVTHLHWISCDEDPQHRPAVMTAVRSQADPRSYRIHGSLLRLEGARLVPEFRWDEVVPEADLEVASDFCGEPIGTAVEG